MRLAGAGESADQAATNEAAAGRESHTPAGSTSDSRDYGSTDGASTCTNTSVDHSTKELAERGVEKALLRVDRLSNAHQVGGFSRCKLGGLGGLAADGGRREDVEKLTSGDKLLGSKKMSTVSAAAAKTAEIGL